MLKLLRRPAPAVLAAAPTVALRFCRFSLGQQGAVASLRPLEGATLEEAKAEFKAQGYRHVATTGDESAPTLHFEKRDVLWTVAFGPKPEGRSYAYAM